MVWCGASTRGSRFHFAAVGRCFLGAAPAVVMVPILAGLQGAGGIALAASAAGVVAIVARIPLGAVCSAAKNWR